MTQDSRHVVQMSGLAFLAGLAAGAAGGVLMAPQSGARTRRQIDHFVADMGERARELADDAKELVGKVL